MWSDRVKSRRAPLLRSIARDPRHGSVPRRLRAVLVSLLLPSRRPGAIEQEPHPLARLTGGPLPELARATDERVACMPAASTR